MNEFVQMDVESYLRWLKNTNLEATSHADLCKAVRSILDALKLEQEESYEGSEQLYQELKVIDEELVNGGMPLQALDSFRKQFGEVPIEPADVLLEKEIRQIAEGMAPEQWATENYQIFENAIDDFLDDGPEDTFWEILDGLDNTIVTAFESYQAKEIVPAEVTAETLVSHKLLCEGLGLWKDSLDILRFAETESDIDWNEVLESAENGNRLLIGVQVYYRRLRESLASV